MKKRMCFIFALTAFADSKSEKELLSYTMTNHIIVGCRILKTNELKFNRISNTLLN